MTHIAKIAEHFSHAFCALVIGIYLGSAFEVIDGRDLARYGQESGALTDLFERTIPSPR